MAHTMIKSILVSEVVRMIAEKFQLPEEEAMDTNQFCPVSMKQIIKFFEE